MNRRKFIGGVGAAVAVACLPATEVLFGGPLAAAPGNMTATEVLARQTLFQEQFMAEFVREFEQRAVFQNLLARVDIKNCGLSEQVDQLIHEELTT